MVVPAYPGRVDLRIKYSVLCHFLVQEFFSDFVGNPRDFFLGGGGGGVGFFSPFDHVRHLKSGLLNLFSWLSVLCTVTYILSHFP